VHVRARGEPNRALPGMIEDHTACASLSLLLVLPRAVQHWRAWLGHVLCGCCDGVEKASR
jgi:hypothetical protein